MSGRRSTRRILLVALCFLGACIVVYTGSSIIAFAQLFGKFTDHSGIRITQGEIAAAYKNRTSSIPPTPVVPKIIHQVFHNWDNPNDDTPPAHWQSARQTCVDLNPDWEHRLWTTRSSRKFIEDEFPWFLSTYDNYKYPIQRVDVIKYFSLRHYGGIYIDMDNGCATNLDPMTYYPAFTIDGGRGALSNNIVGGQRGHPLFVLLTENLIHWQVNYLLPYITIMYSSGQWYLTAMWEKYHSLLSPEGSVLGFSGMGWKPLHHILSNTPPGADPVVFFTHVKGNSWANWDNRMFLFIGDHLVWIFLLVVALVSVIIWTCVRSRSRTQLNGRVYKRLDDLEEATVF